MSEKSTNDFASAPRPLWWLVPRYGRYTKAAVLHDYLCRNGATLEPAVHLSDAGGIFRRSMRELKVDFLRRWIRWSAVRWGTGGLLRISEGGWGEMFGAIAISLLVLPVILPAAIVVLFSLFVFWILKLIVYVAASFTGQRSDWAPNFTGHPASADTEPAYAVSGLPGALSGPAGPGRARLASVRRWDMFVPRRKKAQR